MSYLILSGKRRLNRYFLLIFYYSPAFLLLAYTKYIMEYLSAQARVHPYFGEIALLLCAGYVWYRYAYCGPLPQIYGS